MKLSVDIDKLQDAAKALETAHSNYALEHQKIIKCIESTKEYWKGKDNDKLIEKVLALEPNLKKLEELIGMYADFLRNAASAYDKVDSAIYNKICGI